MDLLRVFGALVVVFGLLGALHYFSKRINKLQLPRLLNASVLSRHFGKSKAKNQSDILRVIQRKNLTASHQVHLIGFGDEELLICTHPQGCTLLSNSERADAAFLHSEFGLQKGGHRLAN